MSSRLALQRSLFPYAAWCFLAFAWGSAGRIQADALSLLDDSRPGRTIAVFNFDDQPLSPPNSTARFQIVSGAGSVDGSKCCVGISTGNASPWTVFYRTPKGLLLRGHRYRVSLDYRILEAPPAPGFCYLVVEGGGGWHPTTVLEGALGEKRHVSYELYHPEGTDPVLAVGIFHQGKLAIDNIRIEELPLIPAGFAPPAGPGEGPLRDHVGVMAHVDWTYFYKTDDQVRLAFDRLQELGTGWARIGLSWNALFSNPDMVPSPQRLQRLNLIVDEAARHQIKLLAILSVSPPEWAVVPHPPDQPAWKYPAAHPADYERYLRFIATTFRGKVAAWEIGNETNSDGFWKAPFADYIQQLRKASGVLRQVDPGSVIVSAGLVDAGLLNVPTARRQPYLDLLKPENARLYDAFGFHTYAGDPMVALYEINIIGERMKAEGTLKPIWVTETGYSVFGKRTEAQQAQIVPHIVQVLASDPLVENVFIYNERMKDFEKKPEERGFGLLRPNFEPRPVFETLKELFSTAVLQKNPTITAADGL